MQGDYVFSDPTYSTDMLTNIFSDADLNRYQQVDSNANLGFSEFFFSPGVPTTNDFYLVTTERNGNNSQFVEAFDGAVSLGMVTITANSNDYSATGAEVGFNQDSNLAVIPMSDFFDSGNPAATVTSIKITYGTTNDGPDHTTFVIGSVPLLLAEISISKDDGESTYTPGENFTYTITVTNNGPDAADGTMVADTLPTWAWAITPMWTCTASGSAVCRDGASGSGDISQTIDTFPNGGQLVYTVSGTYSTVMTDYP